MAQDQRTRQRRQAAKDRRRRKRKAAEPPHGRTLTNVKIINGKLLGWPVR